MFKHIVALIILSVLSVIFKTQLAIVLHWIINWHHHLSTELTSVFSQDKVGLIAQNSLALLLIPLLVTAVVAFALWILRRKMIPFLPEVMWIIWLLLLALITVGQGSV